MPSREERGALTPTLADLGTGEQTPCSFLGEELEIKPKTNKLGLLVQALHLWQQRVRGESWHEARRGFQAEEVLKVKRKKSKTRGHVAPTSQGVFLKKPPKSTFSSSQLELSPFPAWFLGSLPCPEQTPAAPDTPKCCRKGQSGFGTMSPWFFPSDSLPDLQNELICTRSSSM